MVYNFSAIRELLVTVFTPEELRRWCHDRPLFHPVTNQFGPKYNLNDMVDEIVDYCNANSLWEDLLSDIQELNPQQYARFESRLRGAAAGSPSGPKSRQTGDLLAACQKQVEAVLHSVNYEYNSNLYVNRAIEHDLDTFFDTPGPGPNCFLIVAPAGSGKTNLLCDVARRRVHDQPVLLLLGGSLYLGGGKGLLWAIESALESFGTTVRFRVAGHSLHALERAAEEMDRDGLLFLDAINEYERPIQMRKAIEDLLTQAHGRRVKLVVTCRDYYWGFFKEVLREGTTANELPAEAEEAEGDETGYSFSHFAVDEYERALPLYLAHYKITGRPVGNAAEQCRHPLLLRFFCEAYKDQEIGEKPDIRLQELFDLYWERKLASIADQMVHDGDERLPEAIEGELEDYLLRIAAYMLRETTRAIPEEKIGEATGLVEKRGVLRSLYGRIRNEYIILKDEVQGKGRHRIEQVVFVYEEFMEYVMARSLLRDWDQAGLDDEAIPGEIESLTAKYTSFAQIIGVMVYLSLMLRDARNLALWPLLLYKGDQWRTVIFETFRKLPERQIDSGVYQVLSEMLATGDQAIQVQVLDTLKRRCMGRAAPPPLISAVAGLAAHREEAIARRAALALGSMAAPLAVPALLKATVDRRPSVQQNAATGLNRVGSDATALLIAALGSDERRVRKAATQALRKLGYAATEPLIAALGANDANVRRSTAQLLGELGDARAVEPLVAALQDDDGDVRYRAAVALGGQGDVRAVDPLLAALRNKVSSVQLEATRALGQIWQLPDLFALGSESGNERRHAAQLLGELSDARAEEPLVAALWDRNSSVRRSAVWALGRMWQVPAIAQLGDESEDVRRCAAEALGKLGDARAVEPLMATLRDYESSVRCSAAEALGKFPHTRVVEQLIVALRDKDSNVRQSAAEALGKLGDVAIGLLITALQTHFCSVRLGVTRAMGQIWQVPAITQLGDESVDMRHCAAEVLGKLGDARAVEPLMAALRDDECDVRWSAAEALGKLGDARAADSLVAALRDKYSNVRRSATWALGQIRQWPELSRLGDRSNDVRRSAAQVLGELGDPRAVEPLIAALQDDETDVRWSAAWGLGELGDMRAVELLIAALRDKDSNVRRSAAEALGKLGDPRAVEPLVAALQDPEGAVQRGLVRALVGLGDAAVGPVIAALQESNWRTRQNAAVVLGLMADAKVIGPLLTALHDDYASVRHSVVLALQRIGGPELVGHMTCP